MKKPRINKKPEIFNITAEKSIKCFSTAVKLCRYNDISISRYLGGAKEFCFSLAFL